MLIYNTLPQYRDNLDEPLTNGRLAIYNSTGTTLLTIYYDQGKQSIAPNPFPLSDQGKPISNFEVFQDCQVVTQKYIGTDENDNPMYETVDTYRLDYINPDTGSDLANTCKTVGSISEMQALVDMEDKEPVVVTGYYTAGDCPSRVFVWDANSIIANNTVNVFANATGGTTGRFVWQVESDKVDCRCCGIIGDGRINNSNITSASSMCLANNLYLYIPDDHYTVTDGTIDIYCKVIAGNVFFDNNNAGYCTVNLLNHNSILSNTFAGVNCKLVIGSGDWSGNNIKLSNFNSAYPITSTSNFNLIINNGSEEYTFAGCPSGDWIVTSGNHNIRVTATGNANELKGTGKILWATTTVPKFYKIKTSLSNYEEYLMQSCRYHIDLDSYVDIDTYVNIEDAYIFACENGMLNILADCKIIGGLGGVKRNFIVGTNAINLGTTPIIAEYFYSANVLVKSFNISASKYLDMKGKVSDVILTKNLANVSNGTIGGITSNDVTLSKMTVTGSVDSTIVDADRCEFNFEGSNFINLQSSNIRYSYIRSQSTITCNACVWNEVNVNGSIKSNGNSRLTNVTVLNCYLVPNSYKELAGFYWIGGSADRIDLDASQMSVDGEAICHHVTIQHISGLADNINVINGSTRKWRVNGHYSVLIGDNGTESTRATYGTKIAKIYTFVASQKQGSVTGVTDVCIMFNYNPTTPIESAQLLGICPRDNRRWFGAGYGQVIPTGNHINFTWTGVENPQVNELTNITFSLYR